MQPQFSIPLDLPHGGRVAQRIYHFLESRTDTSNPEHVHTHKLSLELVARLLPFKVLGENPAEREAAEIVLVCAQVGRDLVDEIERLRIGDDRLGQAVRNLFECLELGAEGARLSLRAGENPMSLQRPV